MESPGFSAVYEELEEEAKLRYRQKLFRIGEDVIDPYLPVESFLAQDDYPLVDYPDIYNFLIDAPSPYTKEQLKAYKSLEGYRYSVAAWVGGVHAFKAGTTTNVFFSAKVRHSQSVSSKNLEPWVAVNSDGSVLCAHCTCKAGLGEACSHISALLFSLYARTLAVRNTSCTSKPCSWIAPSLKDVEFAKIKDIDFSSPERKQFESTDGGSTRSKIFKEVEPPSGSELNTFFHKLSAAGRASVLSIVPHHCEKFKPTVPEGFPPTLRMLFEPEMLSANFGDLLNRCDFLFSAVGVSPEEAKAVEIATRQQAHSKAWFDYRAGRITASKFKAAVRTDISQPSSSLVRAICYPEACKFTTSATRWGCSHEKEAIAQYTESTSMSHVNFAVSDSGLVIRPGFAFLGATPDACIQCSCCGAGVVEVKCPFGCRDTLLSDAADLGKLCLEKSGEELQLKKSHAYYYQVQLQLFVCEVEYCDFVVFNNKELFIQRITLDESFVKPAVEQAMVFFKCAVLPEMVGKWFTKTFDLPAKELDPPAAASCDSTSVQEEADGPARTVPTWCYCKEQKPGAVAVCSNTKCSIQRFHLSCLKLKSKPARRSWLCPECRKSKPKASKRQSVSSASVNT